MIKLNRRIVGFMLSLFAVSAGSSGVSADCSPLTVLGNAWNLDRDNYTDAWNNSNGVDKYVCYPGALPVNLARNYPKSAGGIAALGAGGAVATYFLLVKGNNNAVADGSEEQMGSNVGNVENNVEYNVEYNVEDNYENEIDD